MIYVDSSAVLAQILAENVRPPESMWGQPLITSRITTYETWTRVNARGLTRSHGDDLRHVLERMALVELSPSVLARALEPWPVALRTLDSLHLATMEWLRQQGQHVELACFDARLIDAAARLGFAQWVASPG